MKLMVTGHRPKSMFGNDIPNDRKYDLNDEIWTPVRKWFRKKFDELKPTELITGMALGVDQVFCQEALAYKARADHDVHIVAAVPCLEHDSRWQDASKELYHELLDQCDEVHINEVPYKSSVMQERNEYMVDRCDLVLGVWNGSTGGTYNCLVYASDNKKRIHRFIPGGAEC